MSRTNRQPRTGSFEKQDTLVVKGTAILLMLFYHLFESQQLLESMEVDYRPFSENVFLTISGFGNICVAVFAFLSAYGITKGLMREEVTLAVRLRQAGRRCLKLLGNFLVMYLSVNLLWFSYFDYKNLYGSGWQGGVLAVIDMLGLAPLFDTPTLNMTWWYMELAILIIFVVPLLYPLVKKAGKYLLAPALLLPFAVNLQSDFQRYYFVVVFGMLAATEGWYEKLFRWKLAKGWKCLLGVILMGVCVLFRQNFIIYTYFVWIVDAPIAFFLGWFGWEIVGRIPGVSKVFAFLGTYSMDMYFVHTFFYMAIYQKFIYSFHNAGLIFLVLVGISLLYAVILEAVKKGGMGLWRRCRAKRVQK